MCIFTNLLPYPPALHQGWNQFPPPPLFPEPYEGNVTYLIVLVVALGWWEVNNCRVKTGAHGWGFLPQAVVGQS
jgi:hypothetical protein